MPTGKHFNIRVYDDIINQEHVATEDQIKKAINMWELSLSLGSAIPVKRYGVGNIERYIGTRYHIADPYSVIIERDVAKPRLYPATIDGKEDGKPVFYSRKWLREKRKGMTAYNFGCQYLINPTADKIQGFDENWLRHWHPKNLSKMNLYLLVDPANAKNKKNDYTSMGVIALSEDQNYRMVEGIRARLNLTERTRELFRLHKKYGRLIKAVGYEQYGMQADKQHIEYVQDQEQYNFKITSLGGNMPKLERIRLLIPIIENGRWFLMGLEEGYFIDEEKREQNFARLFLNELNAFPVGAHEDILDMAARILDEDLHATFPVGQGQMQEQGEQAFPDRGDNLFWRDMPNQGGSSGGATNPSGGNLIELDKDGYFSRVQHPGQTSTERQTARESMWR